MTPAYRKSILSLASLLNKSKFIEEAETALSLIHKRANQDIQPWYDLYEETTSTEPSPILDQMGKFLNSAKYYFDQASKGLAGAKKEDIKNLVENIPLEQIAPKMGSYNQLLIKIGSSNSQDFNRQMAEFLYKEGFIQAPEYKKAGWWKNITGIGGTTLRYTLPFFSLIFAIHNLYYCSVAYQRLVSDLPQAGISWKDSLDPNKINQAIDQHQDNPVILKKIAKASKNIDMFLDEFISMVLNFIDGLKDILFFILNFSGFFIVIDLGISFGLAILEYSIESKQLEGYKKINEKLRNMAIEKIKEYQDLELLGAAKQTSTQEITPSEKPSSIPRPKSRLETFLEKEEEIAKNKNL